MSIFARLFRRRNRHDDLPGGFWDPEDMHREQAPVADAPTVTYQPHGIDSPQTLAEIVARAEEDARTARASAETEQWGGWDQPPARPAPPLPPLPPPPMPYRGDVSRVMVHRIDYPDPADFEGPDKDRRYRDALRRVGVATGTHGSLEDTGMWALPALEPGDGTGTQL